MAKIIQENDHKIWDVLRYYVENSLNHNVKIIGIDETSQKKRHNYISLFVDLKEKKTIFIAQGKDNQTIKASILEGLNSLIQVAKAKSRGFKTFKNFRIIAF